MGVRQLNKLLLQYTNTGIKDQHLNNYSNKRIAIDISIYIYKFLHYNGDYLYGLLNQIIKLSFYRIMPIYVFDGKSPVQKNNTIDQRKSKREDSYQQIELLQNMLKDTTDDEIRKELKDKIDSFKKKTIHINQLIIENCKRLLDLLNIPHVTSTGEAEQLCCYLVNKDLAYACLSEDTDLIPLGCKRICKKLYFRKNTVVEYDLDNILQELNISYPSLVDLCILCGTDYNTEEYTGLHYERCYYLIQKYKSISNILASNIINDYKGIKNIDYTSIYNIYTINYESLDNQTDQHRSTILCDYSVTIPFSYIIELFKQSNSKKHSGTIIDKLLLLEKNTAHFK
jgi:flap endonuclease-1